MERLLQPDTGLIVWTFVTFVLLLLVLTKAAWKPILEGLNQREGKIKSDLERAEAAQKEAEAMRVKYEAQLAEAQKSIQDMVSQARADGERTRTQLIAAAKDEAERLLEKGRKDLVGETERLKEQLRQDVTALSVAIAEKVLKRSVDGKVQDDVLKESLQEISGAKR